MDSNTTITPTHMAHHVNRDQLSSEPQVEINFLTVSNPTCSILSSERRRKIVEIAARLSREQKRKVPVFFDKAYENLIHDPAVPRPATLPFLLTYQA